MNRSILDGQLNDKYFVFYPHTPGLPALEQEEDLARHLPTYLAEYLLPAKPKLSARRTLARAKQNWWELLEHRAWLEEPSPKIVSKYFGGARSFAFDKEGRFVVVVGNGWVLKKGALEGDITDEEAYLATLTYLNSSVASALLQYFSIQVSGGQSDLTNKYVGQLLIPNLARIPPSSLNRLVETGSAIVRGVAMWNDVDQLVTEVVGGPMGD